MNEPEKAVAGLYALAQSASDNAYSPYSGVRVGACLVDESGNVYSGCNVENSSYGLTQCAERNALAAAIAAGMQPGTAHTLLIYATGFETLAPGGAFVSKIFQGEGFDELFRQAREPFGKLLTRKPKASRPRSREVYLVAKDFQGR